MGKKPLTTAGTVIDKLGGTAAVSRLTKQSQGSVSNWRRRNQIPATYFLTIYEALTACGATVIPEVFGIESPWGAGEGAKTGVDPASSP